MLLARNKSSSPSVKSVTRRNNHNKHHHRGHPIHLSFVLIMLVGIALSIFCIGLYQFHVQMKEHEQKTSTSSSSSSIRQRRGHPPGNKAAPPPPQDDDDVTHPLQDDDDVAASIAEEEEEREQVDAEAVFGLVEPMMMIDESSSSAAAPQYHMVFSTGCSPFQHWQALLFFYHAHKVQQRGTVTRIASGCTTEETKQQIQADFEEQIQPLSPHFFLHITPDFGFTSQTNKYYNKPFGLLDWFEQHLGYVPGRSKQQHDDAIIMILDPDMMLLRPLTHDFTNDFPVEYWMQESYSRRFPPLLKKWKPLEFVVRHGFPISQAYGFGSGWFKSYTRPKDGSESKLDIILEGMEESRKDAPSPLRNLTMDEAAYFYPSGPPYLATARDMYNITKHWVQFVQRIGDHTSAGMMAEMFGYSTAAAHLGLSHQLTEKFMVSDVTMNGEGWDFLKLEDVTKTNACHPPQLSSSSSATAADRARLPYVLHFCQRYALGRWFVGKYKLPEDFFTCQAPLLRTPPSNVGDLYDWFIYPNGKEKEEYFHGKPDDEFHIKKNAFAMCTMMDGLNEVGRHFRQHHCTDQDNANYGETYIFQDATLFDQFLQEGGLGKMI